MVSKTLDPDSVSINPDPEHCYKCILSSGHIDRYGIKDARIGREKINLGRKKFKKIVMVWLEKI